MSALNVLHGILRSVATGAARSPDVISPLAEAAIDLRRDHDVLPRNVKGFSVMPENLFALTRRVIVRRIKEVDAAVNRRFEPVHRHRPAQRR